MSRLLALLLAALILAPASALAAQRYAIGLVTIGPGPIYWQRFGHNAILVEDTRRKTSTLYSYGFFDFAQKNFFWRFVRGAMQYEMDGLPARYDLARYVEEGRSIRLQMLNLSPAQATQTAEFLEWNRDPKRRAYPYDYFLNNCSTKVRDLLDQVLKGQLKRELIGRSRGLTWRMHVLRSLADDLPLWSALHLGLGQPADDALSLWDEAFLPERLSVSLREIRVVQDGETVALVNAERMLSDGAYAAPPDYPPDRLWLALALGLLLAGGAVLMMRKAPRAWLTRALTSAWLLLTGLAGCVLLGLGFLTAHHMAWPNENVLIMSPLAVLLLVFYRPALRRRLWQLLAASTLVAIMIQWLPAFSQANGEVLAFFAPTQLVLAFFAIRQSASKPMRPVT